MSTTLAPPVMSTIRRYADRWVIGIAFANLVAQIGIILTGGVVRLTGSGLGCSTWPQCEPGEFAPVLHAESTYHPIIEFGNRTLTGILGVVAIALVVAIWFAPATDGRSGLKKLAFLPLAGVIFQAVLGGVTVLLHLHPGVVGVHFLVSAALVWGSAYLLDRLREGDGAPNPILAPSGWKALWLRAVPATFAVLTAIVVTVGVLTTGSGPHSGDSEVGYRFALDPALIARVHALSVWLFIAALALTVVAIYRSTAVESQRAAMPRLHRRWWILVVVTLAQGLIGYAQYFTGLPVPLVAIHLLGSALLVAAVTFAITSLRTREFHADRGIQDAYSFKDASPTL